MITERDETLGRALRGLEVPEHATGFFDGLAERLEHEHLRRPRRPAGALGFRLVSVAAAVALVLGAVTVVNGRGASTDGQARTTPPTASPFFGPVPPAPGDGAEQPPAGDSTDARGASSGSDPAGADGSGGASGRASRAPARSGGKQPVGPPAAGSEPSGERQSPCGSQEPGPPGDETVLAAPPTTAAPKTKKGHHQSDAPATGTTGSVANTSNDPRASGGDRGRVADTGAVSAAKAPCASP